jgi:hypothetical protein
LELAADASAARFGMSNWINFNDQTEPPLPELPHYLRLWSYALSIFWRLMDVYAPRAKDPQDGVHPEATVRLLNAQLWSSYEVLRNHPELASTYQRELRFGEEEINDLWCRLGIQSPTFRDADWRQKSAGALGMMSSALDRLPGLARCQDLRTEFVHQRRRRAGQQSG